MRLFKYTHPACMNYDTTKSYELEELKNDLSDEMIDVMFKEINLNVEDKVVDKQFKK